MDNGTDHEREVWVCKSDDHAGEWPCAKPRMSVSEKNYVKHKEWGCPDETQEWTENATHDITNATTGAAYVKAVNF